MSPSRLLLGFSPEIDLAMGGNAAMRRRSGLPSPHLMYVQSPWYCFRHVSSRYIPALSTDTLFPTPLAISPALPLDSYNAPGRRAMPADAKRKRDSPALSDTASRPRPAPFASGSGSRDNVATENKDAPPGDSASGGYASPRTNDKNQGAAHEMITMGAISSFTRQIGRAHV